MARRGLGWGDYYVYKIFSEYYRNKYTTSFPSKRAWKANYLRKRNRNPRKTGLEFKKNAKGILMVPLFLLDLLFF